MDPCYSLLILLFSIFQIQPHFSQATNFGPIVKTECGRIEGKVINTPKRDCQAYLGVPFAAPPVADRRWKKPQPVQCWNGTRQATDFGPQCVQASRSPDRPLEGSEDCLYLNVIVPESPPPGKLPVMVFIHGGSFSTGTAADYGVDGPCENVCSRGVIIVTIQYRLFMYGLFSTGDSVAPGNYAIWDQIEALRWVSNNIDAFGGDPRRVTIFGQSAGGASVSYLTYIRSAEDLFQRSIAQSGSALGFSFQPRESSSRSARELGLAANCTSSNDSMSSDNLVTCLRRLSTSELQKVYNSHFDVSSSHLDFYTRWSIRVDGELFTEAKFDKPLKPGKPTVIGSNTMELFKPKVHQIPKAAELFNSTLDEIIRSSNATNALKDAAYSFYIDSKGDRNNATFVVQQLAKLQADRRYHAPSAQEASSKSAVGYPLWVYSFDYRSRNVFGKKFPFEKGAPHGHELCYLFLIRNGSKNENNRILECPSNYDGIYRRMADRLGEIWTNFAINGDPSPRNFTWPKYRHTMHGPALVIRGELSIEDQYYSAVDRFWSESVYGLDE